MLLGLQFSFLNAQISEDPSQFLGQATSLIQSYNTEATYQISNKFTTAWSQLSESQRKSVIEIAVGMDQKGHTKNTFFNYYAYIGFAINQEGLSSAEMTKVLEVNKEVLQIRTKSEYAEFVHGLNFFFARRYLAFNPAIKTQALGGTYEFKVLNADPDALVAPDGSILDLDAYYSFMY